MPVSPHVHHDATPGATSGVEPHPVIAAAYAAAHGRTDPPARHKAPLRPPSRRAWMAVGLLMTLTALPMLVVILAGRAGLRSPGDLPPYRADGGPPVVIEPGPQGANRRNDSAVAPEAADPVSPDRAAAGAGTAGGGRVEATPCPTASGPGGARAAGGGASPAGGGSSSGSGGDAGSGAPGGAAPGGGPVGGAPGAAGDSGGSGSDRGGSHDDGSPGGSDGASDGASDGGGSTAGDDPSAGGPGDSADQPPRSSESTPGRNFIERVFGELGIPLP